MLAWLPTILIDQGVKSDLAGWMMSINQFAAFTDCFVDSYLGAMVFASTRFCCLCLLFLLFGLGGLIWFQGKWVLFWVVIMGMSTSLLFSLTLVFFVL